MSEENGLKFPDKDLAREGWLDIVKPVEMAGRLDHIPARKPVTKKDHDTAKKQNYWLTRRSYVMPGGYDCINWGKKHREGKEREEGHAATEPTN